MTYVEEIKAVAQVVATMADAGKEAFVWWLIAEKLVPPVVSAAGWVAALSIVARLLGKAVDVARSYFAGEAVALELRNVLRPTMHPEWGLSAEDERVVRRFIAEVRAQMAAKDVAAERAAG